MIRDLNPASRVPSGHLGRRQPLLTQLEYLKHTVKGRPMVLQRSVKLSNRTNLERARERTREVLLKDCLCHTMYSKDSSGFAAECAPDPVDNAISVEASSFGASQLSPLSLKVVLRVDATGCVTGLTVLATHWVCDWVGLVCCAVA